LTLCNESEGSLKVIAQYPLIFPGPVNWQTAEKTLVPIDPVPSLQLILFSPASTGIESTVRIVPNTAIPT
jgi:hypothetical protein